MCVLIEPQLDQNGIEQEVSLILDVLNNNGARLVHKELWGKRSLAYPIKKNNEGYYYLFYFEAEPSSVKSVESALKHKENIMRILVIRKKEFPEKIKNNGS